MALSFSATAERPVYIQSTEDSDDRDDASTHHRVVYVERTSPRPEVTSQRSHVTTSSESLVIVVEMTERSTAARRPTLESTVRPPPYRLLTTTAGVAAAASAAGDGGGPAGAAAAERVAINVGLIVGIVGAVSTLVVMLAALLLCRPRTHVAQSSPKLKHSSVVLGSRSWQ